MPSSDNQHSKNDNQYGRNGRQAEEVRKALNNIIREEIKDPRIPEVFSVTDVELSRDLRYAKVAVSAITKDENEQKAMLKALKGASGFIRHELGQRVLLRALPELNFEADHSIAYSVRISSLLNQIAEQAPGSDAKAEAEDKPE